MTHSGDDEQDCLERLEHHESRLDKLFQLLGRSGRVVGRDDDLTRELYRAIRTDLKHEAHLDDTERGEAALTNAKRIWCQNAVVRAYAELPAPTTASLDRKLLASVGRARGMMRQAVEQLRAHLGITRKEAV